MFLSILLSFNCKCLSQTGDTGWDSLYSTFGSFYSVPITQSSAESDKWDMILDCDDKSSPGIVYSENGDISTMPFYNNNGYIAGIILGMLDPGASSETLNYPFKTYQFKNGTIFWGIEAHFRDPDTTCQNNNNVNSNGTIGDR